MNMLKSKLAKVRVLMIYRTVCNQISSDVYELLRMLSLEECHIRKLLSRTTAFRLRAP